MTKKKRPFDSNLDKTKHGLRKRREIVPSFWLGIYRGERKNERREEEENPCLEIDIGLFGISLLVRTLVFLSMGPICMVLLVRKPS